MRQPHRQRMLRRWQHALLRCSGSRRLTSWTWLSSCCVRRHRLEASSPICSTCRLLRFTACSCAKSAEQSSLAPQRHPRPLRPRSEPHCLADLERIRLPANYPVSIVALARHTLDAPTRTHVPILCNISWRPHASTSSMFAARRSCVDYISPAGVSVATAWTSVHVQWRR